MEGLNSCSINFTLKIAQSARKIWACVGCSVLKTANQCSEAVLLFASDRFRQACSPVGIHMDWLYFADIFALRQSNTLVWLLGYVDSCKCELACLLTAERKLGLELGDLLIEVLITPTQPVVDVNPKHS